MSIQQMGFRVIKFLGEIKALYGEKRGTLEFAFAWKIEGLDGFGN